jgi:hypothetical protein
MPKVTYTGATVRKLAVAMTLLPFFISHAAGQDAVPPDAYAPEVKETILVSQGNANSIAWDSGTLEFDIRNPQGANKHVSVTFGGVGDVRVTSLVVATTDWRADITNYAARLTTPVTSRIRVDQLTWSGTGDIEQIIVGMPYLTDDGVCLEMSLVIEATGVLRSRYDVPGGDCYL